MIWAAAGVNGVTSGLALRRSRARGLYERTARSSGDRDERG